jgi:hypothetical protein
MSGVATQSSLIAAAAKGGTTSAEKSLKRFAGKLTAPSRSPRLPLVKDRMQWPGERSQQKRATRFRMARFA